MGAYRVVLTHFSQRYRNAPWYDTECPAGSRAVPAFDGMVLNLADLQRLPRAERALRAAAEIY
jgi:ribonuclease BN (tRNA processing enzyme)